MRQAAVEVPPIEHLQMLILTLLQEKVMQGPDLHMELRKWGACPTGPSFYQAMKRMEDRGLVTGYREGYGRNRKKEYCCTEYGKKVYQRTVSFYQHLISTGEFNV